VSDHPVHRDDITALRAEDDLKTFMRSLIQPTKRPAPNKPRRKKPAWGVIPIPADHKPGAWPTGTSPPGPPPERDIPAADWAYLDALRRGVEPTDPRLAQDWLAGPHQANQEQARASAG
jgi:hypothetical protein